MVLMTGALRGARARACQPLLPAARRALCASQGAATAAKPAAAASGCPFANAKDPSEIPGLRQWPLVAALPSMLAYRDAKAGGVRNCQMMADKLREFGPVFLFVDDGTRKVYAVSSPDYQRVLDIESDNIKGIMDNLWSLKDFYRLEHPNEASNPFLLRGDEWRKGRMAVNPIMFNVKAAKSYLPEINRAAAAASGNIRAFEENLGDFCSYASVDMFNAMAFGVNLRASAGDPEGLRTTKVLLDGLNGLADIMRTSPWSRKDMLKFGAWKSFVKSWKDVETEVEALLDRCLADPDNAGFFKAFVSNDKDISRFQTMSMVAILAAAAADTTSATIMNTLFNLSRNPEVQQRLREELRAELGGKDWQASSRSSYLNWVLYETQRVTPTLMFSHTRNDIEEDVVVEGFRIPKGSSVLYTHHNLARAVDRPDEFIPERWSDEEKAKRKGTPLEFLDHPVTREPFGFGPRKCVGSRVALLEIKSLVSRVVQDYEFHFDAETSAPFEMVSLITNMPRPFPHIRFTPITANPSSVS